jgi:cell division protein FtsI (penicillin-binding protein 3)
MDGMDALALLENLGLKVKVIGIGRVKKQSLTSGQAFNKNQTIIIELS